LATIHCLIQKALIEKGDLSMSLAKDYDIDPTISKKATWKNLIGMAQRLQRRHPRSQEWLDHGRVPQLIPSGRAGIFPSQIHEILR
jgi:hypothetical protein